LSLYYICRSLSRESDDIWDRRMKEHWKMWEVALAGLGELKYDRNEDGLQDKQETARPNRRSFSV
jgi:hypothetical protein